jgi:hypothetical protein
MLAVSVCACDRGSVSKAQDTPIVQSMEQYEASLPYNPVRDSADAVARALAMPNPYGSRSTQRVTSVTSDSEGYHITIDIEGPYHVVRGARVLVKRNGALYLVGDLR